MSIYYSLFQSHLTYCSCIYGLKQKQITIELARLQLKVLSIIFNCSQSKVKPIMKANRILTAPNLIRLQIAVTMYRAYRTELPSPIQARFTRHKDASIRSSISSRNFVVKRSNSKNQDNCVSYAGVKLWNSLPNEIKDANNIQVFKKLYKSNLLTGQ